MWRSQAIGSRVTHVVWRLSFVCAESKRVTSMSDVARARGPAAHRRERRLRALWRHEIMSVKMATNSANHHSAQRQTVLYVDAGTQTCTWTYMDSEKESLDDSLSGNESPALVFTSTAPSPVTHHVAATLAATYAATASFSAPATAIEFETPSPCDRVRDARTIHLSTCSSD